MREVIESKINEIQVLGTQEFMGKQVPVIEGGFGIGKRCLTDKGIAEIHHMTNFNVRKRISDNISRFKEDIDIIDIKRIYDVNTLMSLGYNKQSITQAQHIYLLSERGYAKLIKIMDTDLAWEIHDKLIDEYFTMKEVLRALTREQKLVLDLYEGGVKGIEANKELIQIEVDKNSKIYEEKIKIQEENARLKLELVKKELKQKIDDLQDGNNKIMSVSQLVNSLEIPGLTTTIFNKWLCKKRIW